MKKIIATLTLIVTIMTLFTVPALASQPGYPNSNPSRWAKDTDQEFKEWEEMFSERATGHWYKGHNMLISWYIESQQNHQYVIAKPFPRKKFYDFHSERVDFIEFGKLYEAKNEGEIEALKKTFEKYPVDAALRFIFPIRTIDSEDLDSKNLEDYISKLQKDIENRNIPIYWNVKTMKWDPKFYTVEVAIGKYVIQQGDTLSKIAEKFDTSVDEIMEKNKNIENPDLIYAGNYLCIW